MEKIDIKAMIESVLVDITGNAPIENYIYKLRLIAKYLDNNSFKIFIEKEFFDGYIETDIIPEYRIINSQIRYAGITSLYRLGEPPISIKNRDIDISQVKIYDSLPRILDLSKSSKNLIRHLTSKEKGQLIYHADVKAHKEFEPSALNIIPRAVKSKLLDFIVQLNDEVFNDGIDFNVMSKKADIEKIVHNNFNAGIVHTGVGSIDVDRSNIIGGQNNTITISEETKQQITDIVNRIDKLSQEIDEDRTDIAEAILDIRTELDNKINKLKILKTAFNAIKGVVGVGKIYDLAQKATELLQKNV